MGSFDFSIPAELQKQISRMANIDTLAPKMLNRAAPIVHAAIKARTPRNTGALAESLTVRKPKQEKKGGWSCKIAFEGTDDRSVPSKKSPAKSRASVSNNQKAAVLEFGTTKRRANPFVRPAVDSVKQEVAQAMQAVIDEEGTS